MKLCPVARTVCPATFTMERHLPELIRILERAAEGRR